MSFTMTVKIPSLAKLPRRVDRSIKAAAAAALVDADHALGNEAGQQINTQGARLGAPWRKLRPITVRNRTKRYPSTYYGKHQSGSGPREPIGVWTGRLRGHIGKPGQVSKAALTATRKYQSGANPDRSAQQRLFYLHQGRIGSKQPSRPIFVFRQGGKMSAAAMASFARRFGLRFEIEMKRP